MSVERPLGELLDQLAEAERAFAQAEQNRLHAIHMAQSSLRSARISSDMSQASLAAATGKTQAYVSQVENGVLTPSSFTLAAFLQAIRNGGTDGDANTQA